ncbi:uncharacterized protein CXorf49-like [Ochotona princeps]|uniref:uncharacterized protein CXorf49-like n=1 Tax=Ochotona princeps TaxID=9978 RepID=UPI002714D34D|nr:uncharacterized protein CXorf49-like [Ochotona princeps]
MSSQSKVSGLGDRVGHIRGEQAGPGSPCASQAREPGSDLGPPGRGEGNGRDQGQDLGDGAGQCRPSSPLAFKWLLDLDSASESEAETIQIELSELWSSQAWPGTSAPDGQDPVDDVTHIPEPWGAYRQSGRDPDVRAERRVPSIESGCPEAASVWEHPQTDPSGRGEQGPSCVESLRPCAGPQHDSVPSRGQSQDCAVIRWISGGPTQGRIPVEAAASPTYSASQAREKFPHEQSGAPLTAAPRDLTWATQVQTVGEAGPGFSKEMQGVVSQKGGHTPRHLTAAGTEPAGTEAAAPVTTSRASPRKKAGQKKKASRAAPQVVLGGAFPPWGYRGLAGPADPATIPPVLGISLLEKPSPSSTIPSKPRQPQQGDSGKKSGASRKSQPAAARQARPNRDPLQRAQLPAQVTESPSGYMRHAEFRCAHAHTQDHSVPENLQPRGSSPRHHQPIGPAHSGHQESHVHPQRSKRRQLPPGIEGCPRCIALEKEAEDLRERIDVMRSLAERYQTL